MNPKTKREIYDHHRRLFLENSNYIWYINSRGFFERYEKREEEDITEENFERVKGSYDYLKKVYIVTILKHKYTVKVEIARYFNRNYNHKEIILHRDRNWKNCNIDNLYFMSQSIYPRKRSKREVILKDKITGKETLYHTVTELSQAIHVDYSLIYKVLKGQVYSQVLSRYEIIRL